MKQISKCRICGYKKFDLIMSLGKNLYFTGRFPKKFQKVPKAILTLIKCKKCDLVQLQHNFDKKRADAWKLLWLSVILKFLDGKSF